MKAKVRFDASAYVWAHGKAPRGHGSWAFGAKRDADVADVVWVHGASFVDAKRDAAKVFAARGVRVVWVLS